jgi:hypothetical protein
VFFSAARAICAACSLCAQAVGLYRCGVKVEVLETLLNHKSGVVEKRRYQLPCGNLS